MNLTDNGLEMIEKYADKKKKADILLMVQILREIREVKDLLQASNYSCDCGNNCTKSTDNSEN